MELTLLKKTIYQGDTISILIKSDKPLYKQKLFFKGKYYPILKIGKNRWHVNIGTDVKTTPKKYPIFYKTIASSGKKIGIKKHVHILKGNFRKSFITIPKKKKKLAKAKYINRESGIIGKIFKKVSPTKYWQGIFKMPVKGTTTTPYGAARFYDNGKMTWWHKGIDIHNKIGTPIYAPNHGKVVLSEDFVSHGQTMIIDHGHSVYSILIHLHSRLVKTGTSVKKGQKIAILGNSGIATGPHLHWGLSVNNIRVNPLFWIKNEIF